MSGEATLVPFDASHLDGAVRLSRQAGWRHRKEDWAFTAALSNGYAALLDGQVVGTALCADFVTQTAICLVIVEERLRGRGLGRQLMQAVMALSEGRPIVLSATIEGRPLYEKLGFVETDTIVQMQGRVARLPPAADVRFRDANRADLAQLAALDRDAFGADRTALYEQLLDVGRVLVADRGFAALREFGPGELVGPLVARDAHTARALIRACATEGGYLRVDTTATTGLEPFLAEFGLQNANGSVSMRRGPPRAPAREYTTFAFASQAIG